MSSILDALRKLEEEKAAAQAPDVPINDDDAERDLMGGRAWSSHMPLRLTPVTVIVGGLVVVALVLSASIGTAVILTRGNSPAVTASAPPPAPVTDPATTSAAAAVEPEPALPEEPAASVETTSQAPTPPPRAVTAGPIELATPKPEPRVERRSAPPVQIAKQETESTPTGPNNVNQQRLDDPFRHPVTAEPEGPAATPAPDPEPVMQTEPDPVPQAPVQTQPAPEPAPAAEPLPRDIRQLPPLTPMLQSQYKLDGKDINMTRPKDDNHPTGSVVIDLVPTWEGETIRGTNARVVTVERHGIAVEIIGTGERYYWRFR